MPITVNCPSCHSTHTVPEGPAGGRVECPQCGASVEVPWGEDNPYAPPSSSLEPGIEAGGMTLVIPGSLAGKFGAAFQLYFSNLPLISLLVLTIWLPANVILSLMRANAPDADVVTQIKLNNIVEGIFGPIYAGGVIYSLARRMRGERVTYLEALSVGVHNWVRLWGARFVAGLMVLLGMIALIVPGVILQVRYALIDPVVILEGVGASASRERSTRLTEGRRWQIFFAGIMYFVSLILLSFALGFAIEQVNVYQSPWFEVVSDCVLDIVTAYVTVLMFVFYWEARYQKEPERADSDFFLERPDAPDSFRTL